MKSLIIGCGGSSSFAKKGETARLSRESAARGRGVWPRWLENRCVAYNFVSGDRAQQLMLMPPSVADWLPEGHLAWFVLDVVAELDLSTFYARYRSDGRGGAAYIPDFRPHRDHAVLGRLRNKSGSSDTSVGGVSVP